MRMPALFALSVILALPACNEADKPAPQQTAPAGEATRPATHAPEAEPTMQIPVGPPPAGATDPATPVARNADTCGAAKAQAHMNSLPTRDVLAALRDEIGHDRIRIIEPGMAVTMDYRPDRLNLETGADGRIKVIRCG